MYTSENILIRKPALKAMVVTVLILIVSLNALAQTGGIRWSGDGNSYYSVKENELLQYTLPDNKSKVIISRQQLTPQESTTPLKISYYTLTNDQQKALIFTNTKKCGGCNQKVTTGSLI